MRWTRLSFYYLITYLAFGGVGLMAAPDLAVRLLLGTGTYQEMPMRFLGAFMISLSIIVFQIRRHQIEVLYPTTLIVRVVLLSTILWLYTKSSDPLFLTLAGIVGLGMVFTGLGLVTDRRASGSAAAA